MTGDQLTNARRAARPGRVAAVRSRLATARSKAVTRLREARKRSGAVDAMARAWEYDTEVGGGLMAGALAFRLFLFMVPYTLVAFTLLGSTTSLLASSPREMADRAGISGVLAKGIFTTNSLSTTHQMVILVVGGYALVRTARTVITTIVAAYCLAWRMPKVKMRPLKATLLFIAFITCAMLLTSYLGRLRAAAPAPGLALTLAWLLVPLLVAWRASVRLPHGDAPEWALLPGAVVFAVGLQAMHLFTVYYVAHSVTKKTETYGTIGVALVALAWAYMVGRLMVGMAVVNAALWRRFTDRHPDALTAAARDSRGVKARLELWWAWARSAAGLLR